MSAYEHRLLINNVWLETEDRIPVVNPFSGEVLAEVCRAGEADILQAVEAAAAAFETMRVQPAHERAALLAETAELVRRDREAFAELIALEAGKPLAAARGEAARAAATFALAAQEAVRMAGEVLPLDISPAAGNRIGITRRFPIGPILAITPFNFPLNLAVHKIAPALAAGNPVVHKPSSSTPLTALKLGQVLIEAGMPPGALSVVPCAAAAAEDLVRKETLKMVSFTGSPAVGWRLKGVCGRKKVSLELGGNAAAVIEPDADLALALERCAAGGYAYAGQVCISLQRIYVHERIYAEFERRLVERVSALKIGDPLGEETFVGPLINAREAARVHEWVLEAQALGGRVLTGGTLNGSFYSPTVLADVPARARCVGEEVFGPVTVLFPYREFDEALARVNDSSYGLQAGVFTRDIEKIMRAFNRLEVGGVMINEVPTFRVDSFPYGGVKKSGFGREGVRYAMEEMTEIKVMVVHNTL